MKGATYGTILPLKGLLVQNYFSQDGSKQEGPVEAAGLLAMGVAPTTLVWRAGLADWTPAGELEELAQVFDVASPSTVPDAAGEAVASDAGANRSPYDSLSTEATDNHESPSSAYLASRQIGYAPHVAAAPTAGYAVASLVLGIMGLPGSCIYGLGIILGILAVVFGHIARGQIRQGQFGGNGMAVAGLVMGYISIVFSLAVIVILVIFFAAMATGMPF